MDTQDEQALESLLEDLRKQRAAIEEPTLEELQALVEGALNDERAAAIRSLAAIRPELAAHLELLRRPDPILDQVYARALEEGLRQRRRAVDTGIGHRFRRWLSAWIHRPAAILPVALALLTLVALPRFIEQEETTGAVFFSDTSQPSRLRGGMRELADGESFQVTVDGDPRFHHYLLLELTEREARLLEEGPLDEDGQLIELVDHAEPGVRFLAVVRLANPATAAAIVAATTQKLRQTPEPGFDDGPARQKRLEEALEPLVHGPFTVDLSEPVRSRR